MLNSRIPSFLTRVRARIARDGSRAYHNTVAAFLNNGITAYWADFANFGDQITPLLLRHYGFTPFHAPPDRAQLVSTGSILEHVPENYSGLIVGSGLIHESSRLSFPNAKIVAVRGRLTQERLGLASRNIRLGDPGLLALTFLRKREIKKYVLGLVPHYVDKANTALSDIVRSNPLDCTFIDVEKKNSLDVIRQIDQCENVISSSLHGLIVADSLGIPNAWMFSRELTGDRFKFDDYYSSLDILNPNPIELTGTEPVNALVSKVTAKSVERIADMIDGLSKEFGILRSHML